MLSAVLVQAVRTSGIYLTCVALAVCVAALPCKADRVVYRWVDERGVTHIADEAPAGVKAQRITLPGSPTPPAAATPTPPAPAAPAALPRSAAPDAPLTRPTAPSVSADSYEGLPAPDVPLSEMTLEELDQRCEAARERALAPLRAAEIERCKSERGNDPDWCERFFADFGEGGRTMSGAMRPRSFGDLPECQEALEERRRRPMQ
jgi:hypothetical protein